MVKVDQQIQQFTSGGFVCTPRTLQYVHLNHSISSQIHANSLSDPEFLRQEERLKEEIQVALDVLSMSIF